MAIGLFFLILAILLAVAMPIRSPGKMPAINSLDGDALAAAAYTI